MGRHCVDLRRTRRLALVAALLLAPGLNASARDGVDVGAPSSFTRLVPAEQVESNARMQYNQMLLRAREQRALAPDDYPQVRRLRAIAQRLIPFASAWNPRANSWHWEVNLLGSKQINAFCMPGGKIAFYTGILDQLKLTDDEVAMVMGHEIAHALREHARERMSKGLITEGLARLGGVVAAGALGVDPRITDGVARGGANLLVLKFSRGDESEADLVGLELAARAGFDPRAAVRLWQKMSAANRNAPPQWLSTHPSGNTRIADIEKALPQVLPLYQQAHAAHAVPAQTQ